MTNTKPTQKQNQPPETPNVWLRDVDTANGARYDAMKALSESKVAPILQSSPYAKSRKRGARMAECSESIYGFTYLNEKNERKFKVLYANTCRVRVCPSCSFRLARKRFILGSNALRQIYDEECRKSYAYRCRFIFLTLTVKNVPVGELKEAVRGMGKAWKRLMNRRTVKTHVEGFLRSLEVTRGADGTAHPHFHVLLLMKPSYFDGKMGRYHTSDWAQMWGESLGVDYTPVCDVRAIKPNKRKGLGAVESSLLELMKYVTKYDEALLNDPDFFLEFEHQIEGVRFFGSGGRLKDVLKESMTEEELDEALDALEEQEELRRYFFHWYRNYQRYGGI